MESQYTREAPPTGVERSGEDILAENAALRQRLEELSLRDDLLHSVLENVPDLILIVALNGAIRFSNRPVPGFGPRAEDVVGRQIRSLYTDPPSRRAARACLARVVRTGAPSSFEGLALGPDQKPRHYESRVGPIKRDEEVIALAWIASDVSYHKEIEHTLHEQRERLQLAISAARMGLWKVDPQSKRITWDPSMKRLLGLSPQAPDPTLEEYLQRVHPDDLPLFQEAISRIPENGVLEELEHRLKMPDGSERWLLSNGRTILDEQGRRIDFLGGTIDITWCKRAEETLAQLLSRAREQRERSAFLAEASRVLSRSLDDSTTLHAVARLLVPRFADIILIELLDEKGDFDPEAPVLVLSIHPEEEAFYREMRRRYPHRKEDILWGAQLRGRPFLLEPGEDESLLRQVAQDEEHLRRLRRITKRSTLLVPLEVWERYLGFLSLGSDERSYGEDDLALVEELGRRAAVAIDNARLYREAKDAIRARDAFLSIASHELKTPLTPLWLRLQGILRMQQRAEGKLSAPNLLPGLESMARQLDRLRRLIEELLDISRLTTGQLKLEVEELDLVVLVREILERSSEEVKRAGIALTLDAPGTLWGCWDRLRLDQIITNLLSNALKYGSGKPVEIRLEEGEGRAHLLVRDHGIGIEPGDQERIFGRFERAVSERHYGGFGLGLWITRQIVEAMGGSISVQSHPGQGSTFFVELPRKTCPMQTQKRVGLVENNTPKARG